jgi:hypothetical protein
VFTDKDSLIKKHNVIIKRLLVLKLLCFTDRLPSSFITHYFITKLIISYYIEFILFYIIKLLPSTLIILGMPWLKKYNLGINFPILELKFNFNYYTYNCLPWYIPDYNWVVLYGCIIQLTLRYRQLIVKEVPNTSEPIYAVNKVEILKDWITTPPLRNTALPLKI